MKNKILFGGNDNDIINPTKQIEVFLSIIILGYFGIKIVYGTFFNFYPQKYYYKNITISTNESSDNSANTENITLNAYMPGVWNNEMTDFVTLIVLCGVIFVYTNVSTKSFIDINGNLSLSFLFGYIIGLGYPAIYSNYVKLYNNEVNSSTMIKYMYLIILVIFIVFIIILNYSQSKKISSYHKINYLVYACSIILLFFGLLFAKKNIKSYNSVTYFYNNGEQCTFAKNGVLQSSGDILNITIPFIVFIMLLLFSYEPEELSMKSLYTFIYGLLLGILVSSISYYGIEYFLIKKPEQECKNLNECILKEMPEPIKEPETTTTNQYVPDNPVINKAMSIISILKIVSIIIIILICIFLSYYYIKK